jgi:uncharacterized zinc-type alcohol dehydrogenase-like protein
MTQARGYAVKTPTSPLAPFSFTRREPGEKDVRIDVAFCGICHSDIHQARDEWGGSLFPMVPGHEIVGRVVQVGRKVRKFRVGDVAGVGCMVDSCRKCPSCRKGLEQHCENHLSLTYNGTEQDGRTPTYGGYSSHVVVDEAFALKVPPKLKALERVAPLLCAGITTYSPLKRWGAGRGKAVGVLGLGGLGHVAVKLAAAMGAEVTVLSRSKAKCADGKRLGAHECAVTTGADADAKLKRRFDLIIDTISADHDIGRALGWLKLDGAVVLVGAPPKPLEVPAFPLLGRKTLAGSMIGGIAETQEMLDFCAAKNVLCDVEVAAMKDVNRAYERVLAGDVRYRFSLDLSTL